MTSIRPLRLNHMNVVVEAFDASVDRFRALYDAEFLLDLPSAQMHAALIGIGRAIFELFVPHEYLLNARFGPYHLGVEYQADMAEVREALAAHEVRTVRDIGIALHTHPADSFGVSFEFYAGDFHDRSWETLGRPMLPAEHWRDAHALGLTGLKGYTIAVRDIAAAEQFLRRFLSAEILYHEDRPTIAARAIGLRIADASVELLTPTADGPIRELLEKGGEGIASSVFSVRDIGQARDYFIDRGVPLIAGLHPDRFALALEHNLGLLFEFTE